jgi:hypothetical protein
MLPGHPRRPSRFLGPHYPRGLAISTPAAPPPSGHAPPTWAPRPPSSPPLPQVVLRKARFVKDCASYLQNCPNPARDVFTHASDPVSSVVVVPILVQEEVLGAIYFTQDAPCDFVNVRRAWGGGQGPLRGQEWGGVTRPGAI